MIDSIKFVPICDNGDATTTYEVIIPENITVEEFINMAINHNDIEHGVFRIFPPDIQRYEDIKLIAEYNRSKINCSSYYNWSKNRIVRRVTANGGWGVMDYDLHL